MTQREEYLAAGLKLLPSGKMNNFAWMKHLGRIGSRLDPTWVWDTPKIVLGVPHKSRTGHHSCCGSKRDYYHKRGCKAAGDGPDDLSDLKDL